MDSGGNETPGWFKIVAGAWIGVVLIVAWRWFGTVLVQDSMVLYLGIGAVPGAQSAALPVVAVRHLPGGVDALGGSGRGLELDSGKGLKESGLGRNDQTHLLNKQLIRIRNKLL